MGNCNIDLRQRCYGQAKVGYIPSKPGADSIHPVLGLLPTRLLAGTVRAMNDCMIKWHPELDLFACEPDRALVIRQYDNRVVMLAYCGNGINYLCASCGLEDGVEVLEVPLDPGIWFIEGRLRSRHYCTVDGEGYDEWWEGQARRLTPEEMRDFEATGTTPFIEETKAEKLWLYLFEICSVFGVGNCYVDSEKITLKVFGDCATPYGWTDPAVLMFTIGDFVDRERHVNEIINQFYDLKDKWRNIEADAAAAIDIIRDDEGDSDDVYSASRDFWK